MSVEEDIELKNLVSQTLESKGVLPKIRAELRANVFLALEENSSTKETLLRNDELSQFVKIPIGPLVLNLIREFLEFFELDFTLSVFDPESKYDNEYCSLSREKMISQLKITDCNISNPLLFEVVDRLIKLNKTKDSNPEKNTEDLNQCDILASGDSSNQLHSPVPLNSTFVKNSKAQSIPLSPIEKESSNSNESIKEEFTLNNDSESGSISEVKIELNEIPSKEELQQKSNESIDLSHTPKDPVEIDLLTFTPVKETKLQEKSKGDPVTGVTETKTDEKKEKPKPAGILGDLPPLTSSQEGFNMNDIKAIINDWSGKTSTKINDELSAESSRKDLESKISGHLKSDGSDLSQKSDNTDFVEDFEEDISDLINGHSPLESQLTIDETISKDSCAADYQESL